MVVTGEHRAVGQPLPKVDALDKVTGKALYGDDVKQPGMLYAKVLRSPHAHARIRRIDTSEAEALRGVAAVVTGKDFPVLSPGASAPQGELSIDIYHLGKLVMARDKALFHGHPVAAVAATSPEIAEEALGLIHVDYQVLPPVLDLLEAMKPDAPLLHEDLFTESMGGKSDAPSNVALHVEASRGDVEQGFAQADVVVERTYTTQMVHQGYIEPDAETAAVYPDGQVVVWANTQGSFAHKNQLAILLDIPVSRIKVIPTEVGGAFGGKIYVRVSPLCIKLSQKAGRPVRLALTRDEVLRATGPGAPSVNTIKVGARRDGTITAIQARLLYDAGAFPGAPVSTAILNGFGPYRTPNLKIDGYDVVTNKPRVAAYRAPGATAACFALASIMDEIAEAVGMDPVEFHLKNAPRAGDPMPNEMPFGGIGVREVLERVRSHPAWTTPLVGNHRGRGLAVGFLRGSTNTTSCHATLNGDGSVNLVVGAVDLSGARTVLMQICAEELGLAPEEVRVTVGDTDTVAHTDGTGGSRITLTGSYAVHLACQELLSKLKARAAEMLRVEPEQVEYAQKQFWARDIAERRVTLAQVAFACIRGGGMPVGSASNPRIKHAPIFSAHLADVDVDPETGKVTLLSYTTFQDVGRAINPPQVEGQMQGGASQGIGWALMEEYDFDDRGVLRNASLLDYRMPTSLDLPMIGAEIIEVLATDGPYGVRGVGETPIIAPPPAIANAIYRATGVRLRRLPMTPERVFWALHSREDSGS